MTSSGGATTQQALALSSIAATSSQHRTPPLKRLGLYGTPLKRLGLYERSMQQKSVKARNVKSMEAAWVATSCTFTPDTTKSSNSNRTATTKASDTSGGTTTESVFDRLYKGTSVASNSHRTPSTTATTTVWNGSRLHQYSGRSSLSRSPTTTIRRTSIGTESRTSAAVSSRMEDLYERQVRKARRQPKTDQQERRLRDRLREERELQECTFRPKLYWGSKISSKKASPPDVAKQAARSCLLSPTMTPPKKLQRPRLPNESIVSPPPPHILSLTPPAKLHSRLPKQINVLPPPPHLLSPMTPPAKLQHQPRLPKEIIVLPPPPPILSSTPPTRLQLHLPKEIIILPPPPHDTKKHRPWHTPSRRQEKMSDFMMVSPLRNPPFVNNQDESSRWITPPIIVAVSGSIAVTKTDETDYGSI